MANVSLEQVKQLISGYLEGLEKENSEETRRMVNYYDKDYYDLLIEATRDVYVLTEKINLLNNILNDLDDLEEE